MGSVDGKPAGTTEDSSFVVLRGNIIEAIRILALRRWVFFVPFCIVTCLGAVASHWLTRSFESSAVIERHDHPVLMNLQQTAATRGYSRIFQPALVRDLTTRDTLADVVERAGLVDDLEYDADGSLTEESRARCLAMAGRLRSGADVRVIQKSDNHDQIRITYRCDNPDWPQRMVKALQDAYIHDTRAKLTEMLHEGQTYFEQVAEERRGKAVGLEEELLRFQADYIGIDPTNPGALRLKLTSLETDRDDLEREIATLEREVDTRRHMLQNYRRRQDQVRSQQRQRSTTGTDTQVPSMAKSAEAQALEAEVRKLLDEIHELQLVRRMTERHPDVAERRAQINRLRERLKAQYIEDAHAIPANRGIAIDDAVAASAVEAATGWDMELAGLEMAFQERLSRLEATQRRLAVVDEDLAKHQALEENVFRYRKDYNLKAELLRQAQADYRDNARRASEIATILAADESERGISFNVVNAPTASVVPVSPRGGTILAFALLGGLAVGAVCVLLRELFDQSYHTAKQVTRSLGLTLLESVDEIITSVDRAKLFRRRLVYAPTAFTILTAAAGLSCAAAYLSLERPRTYERAMDKPRAIWNQVSDNLRSAVAVNRTAPAPQADTPVVANIADTDTDDGPATTLQVELEEFPPAPDGPELSSALAPVQSD